MCGISFNHRDCDSTRMERMSCDIIGLDFAFVNVTQAYHSYENIYYCMR